MSNHGASLIFKERKEQKKKWSEDHDLKHKKEELALAACTYALPDEYRKKIWDNEVPGMWPFEKENFNPSPDDRIKELTKAGALIAAEIDRLLKENLKS